MAHLTGKYQQFFLLLFVLAALFTRPTAGSPPQNNSKEELLVLAGEMGHPGGRLVVALRAEPKTLNPLIALDAPSREVIGAMQADLVHINRATQLRSEEHTSELQSHSDLVCRLL